MKKLSVVLVSAALSLFLSACGGGSSSSNPGVSDSASMTEEEMLEVAEEANEVEMYASVHNNPAKAKETYCGKVLKVSAPVFMIKEDRLIIGANGGSIVVYLPEEEIDELEASQLITVVGLTEDDIQTEVLNLGPMDYDLSCYVMKEAYITADRFEYTGIPKSENDSFPGAWNVEFPGQAVQKVVYFDESEDVSLYEGEEISFSAKDIDGKFYDAVIE